MKQSIRQKQIGETVKRHFSVVLQQEGSYIYGTEVLVTVTNVLMSSDLGLAKIYLSVFNTDNKQAVLLELEHEYRLLRQRLAQRLRTHMRRVPDIRLYLDDTLDEMYHLQEVFKKLRDENQMGDQNPS